ncbi:MAG: MBL fold metallo-hydrolase [Anaerolineae bacterium]|nr:MBL fold metallo-hydrolase [Anaerolineae bacterium]
MFRIINIGVLSQNKFWGETARMREDISATCTLLEIGGQRLLVDPSPRREVLEKLLFDRAGLRPDAIDIVYATHWHGDHLFGLRLFEHATWLMAEAGIAEWRERAPEYRHLSDRFTPAEDALPTGVELFPAPGHTLALAALKMETPWGTLVVAGDAVMNREYFAAEEGYHNSVDFGQAAETIRRIKAAADLVIPGHDSLVLNRK